MPEAKTKSLDLEAGWIRELANILSETGLTEVEIEKNDIRLRVSRQGGTVSAAAIPAAQVLADIPAQSADPATPAPVDHPGTVRSPIVGTAYLSPSPGAPTFVGVGDTVKEGQTVMIIEAMKTMNPITATKSGKVQSILVTDAQPVEFDDPLLIIE